MFPQTQHPLWEQPDRGGSPRWAASRTQRRVPGPSGARWGDCYHCARQHAEKHPAVPGRLRGLPARCGSRGCRQLQPLGRRQQVQADSTVDKICGSSGVFFLCRWGDIKVFWLHKVRRVLGLVFDGHCVQSEEPALRGSCRGYGLHSVSLLFTVVLSHSHIYIFNSCHTAEYRQFFSHVRDHVESKSLYRLHSFFSQICSLSVSQGLWTAG